MLQETSGDKRAEALADTARFALDHDDHHLALITALAAVRAVPADQPAPLSVTRTVRQVLEQTRPSLVECTGSDNGGCIAWHPAGRLLAIGNDRNWIRLWDIEADRIVQTFGTWPFAVPDDLPLDSPAAILATAQLMAMRWSTDGATLLTLHVRSVLDVRSVRDVASDSVANMDADAGNEQLPPCSMVALWSASSGALQQTLVGHYDPDQWGIADHDMTWSADGTRLLISHGSLAQLWDLQQNTLLHELREVSHDYHAIVPSPDTRYAAAVCGTEIRIWDAATDAFLLAIACPGPAIQSVRWSADSTRLLTATGDWTGDAPIPLELQQVRLWDAVTGVQFQAFPGAEGWLSPSGALVLTISDKRLVRIWDSTTAQLRQTILLATDAAAHALAWSPDERSILASTNSTLQIWDVATSTLTRRLPCRLALSAGWSPDSRMVAAVNAYDSRFLVWTVATRQPCCQLRPCPHGVDALSWGADGIRLILQYQGLQASVYGRDQAPVQTQLPAGLRHSSVIWFPDQRRVLISAYPDNPLNERGDDLALPAVRCFEWDTATNSLRDVSIGLDSHAVVAWPVTARIRFSSDGHSYAALTAAAILINDTATHATIQRIPLDAHPYDRVYLAWSLDSTQLLVVRQEHGHGSETQLLHVQIWNGVQGILLQDTALEFMNVAQLHGVGWGIAGPQMLITVYRDSHVLPAAPEIWDLHHGRLLSAPNLPAMPLLQATWSPTGRHIVAFGDRAAWVFDSASGAVIDVVESPTSWGAQFAWSPDGSQLLLSGQWQGHVPLSRQIIDPALLKAELTRRVGECSRNQSRWHEAEAQRYEDIVRSAIPDWQGEQAELTAVADLLTQYDRLMANPPM